ncbi:MAG: phosphonate ABC transporter, permease protein PhnE [Microbacterium sp.]|jgi:phosphonate transport system permease protein|uniref:phosphonate ABC transporter, permease protein PhnE n=1 Tax=unclassified Microbacterium TaxID=2609290 RepID=UPI000DB62582|nr:phosphonate ABC transporter, permease protein PhnE [Microbacterium sp.]PZU39641.1 MAG: phosphonate ABC transporter, permease protein PhnE [Microbacterium sp.]
MTASAPARPARGVRPTPPSKLPATIGFVVAALLVVGCVYLLDADWARLLGLPESVVTYVGLLSQGLFLNPFDEPQSEWWSISFEFMLDSVYIAWVGTLIGALLSLPMGFLAARNVAPAWIVGITRTVLNVIRAIPEFIIAIVFLLPLYGFEPSAGAIALGVGSVGTLGKLTSEAIEGLRPGPVEALRATGAGQLAVLRWGMLPQVLPEIIAFWLYRFEINIRAGAILGALGLGGIGFLLDQLFNGREWARLGIALVVTIIVTIIVDQLSAAVRHRIIGGEAGTARGSVLL